ncbi:MAG TPA: ATP-binding protein [candidate division Zixibacteria bacterium]|nr:ATP-binding protein [candidate division Zixibacteria bacterium]
MANAFEVSADRLSWRCDLSFLPFSCTADMNPLEDFIGQDRAMRAIEFGLGVNKPGFNIFVTGLTGTGKTSIIKAFLRKVTSERAAPGQDAATPDDWCYVYNFADPDRPQVLRVRAGWGKRLKADMEQLVEHLKREAKKTFESEEFAEQRQAMVEEIQNKQQEMMAALVEEARRHDFALRMTPSGMVLLATRNGKPMQESEYLALSAAERKALEEKRREIEEKVEATLREGKKLERQIAEKLNALESEAGQYLVRLPLAELREKYRDHPRVLSYLEAVRDHILGNLGRFKGTEPPAPSTAPGPRFGEAAADPFLPYRVNVFVDNSETQGPPIIVETNPTYHNVFGVVEKKPIVGGYVTDFTLIKAGSISRANGGYLVLYDRDVLSNAGVWEALQRVIKNRELRVEEPATFFGWAPPQGLRPEPIPTDTKVIMIGDPALYRTLATLDPDFRETFKVKADFDYRIDRSQENIVAFACFISDYCTREKLRHLDSGGVARVIEHCARVVEDQYKLSTRFSEIADLLVEADYWARREGAELVSASHVERAVAEKTFRLNLVETRLQELIAEGTLLVDVDGAAVGQVNGLAIYQMGDFSFGKPSRITVKTFMGRDGIVNIERESKLSGKTHDKGVLILGGYLGSRYAQDRPLSLSASICFEQSYDGVDGDSASSTELYGILSSLAELPIRQGIAVTGSVNQNGEIQAIGGINRKIEGFYDVCRIKGLTGTQGVLMPRANLRNLMLRPDVVEAVGAGRFHIYAVATVDEGIEVLTGVEAGRRGPDGRYPEDSVNGRVEKKLQRYAEQLRKLSPAGATAEDGDQR